MKHYDLLFIGAGPGGYVAAIRACQLGAKVGVIEDREVGGTCLNRGCIPTKAMFRSAEVLKETRELESYGLEGKSATANIEAIQNRKNKIIETLRNGVLCLFAAHKIDLMEGFGSFVDHKTVHVVNHDGGEEDVTADHIIIATGSVPYKVDMPGANLEGVITTDELLEIDHIPARLGVIGAGTVGTEFANIFNSFGSEVHVVVKYDRVMRKLDFETVYNFMPTFEASGIHMVKEVKIDGIEKTDKGLVIVSHKQSDGTLVRTEVDEILMSAGRRPNIKGLNLEAAGVKYSEHGIVVDDNYKTNVEGIYAIGDVIGHQMLAHVASAHGEALVEGILGHKSCKPIGKFPDCVFTFPEIATCGITEEEAKKQNIEYKIGKFYFKGNGKALTLGEPEGMCKIIADESDHMIGVHISGPHASDLIHEACVAMENDLTVEQLIHTIHAHPTLAETFWEAAMDVHDRSIHSMPKIKSRRVEAHALTMPKLTESMEEGVVAQWFIEEGDRFKAGDKVFSIEVGKMATQVEAPMDGVLKEICYNVGEKAKVGAVVGRLSHAGIQEVKMAKITKTMTEGIIASWAKKVGDDISAGEVLYSVENCKLATEVTAKASGKLREIYVEAGESAPVDSVIAIIE